MNYYQVLGVPESASDKDIKRAYKKLVKKYHPDIFHGDKEFAENKIKEINEAYETLSEASLKAEYDELLHGSPDGNIDTGYSNRSQAQDNYDYNNRYRDNDFYNSDSYRRYSYRYYGRSHSSQEFENYKRSQAGVSDEDSLFSQTKTKFLILIGVAAIFMIIVLIVLLNILKGLTTTSPFDGLDAGTDQNGILIIERGLPYSVVVNHYGEPSSIKYTNSGFYAFYGSSYIVFDENNKVKNWMNSGDLVTSYQRGDQEEMYNQIYDELQRQMYFEY